MYAVHYGCYFFFFNDTATTEIYTLSLHDALPISRTSASHPERCAPSPGIWLALWVRPSPSRASASGCRDRKSTRLNSSHLVISYAVFCLKKKKPDYQICLSLPTIAISVSLRSDQD